MKNHKIEEKEYLDCFLQTSIGKSWHEKHNIIKIEETESPDFIFETNDEKKIGLEITQFIIESKHGKAMQALATTGNKICKYSLNKHKLPISIIIDKYDKRKYEARTKEQILEVCYNPGFIDRFNEREIKAQIEPIIDNNLDQLKTFPRLIKPWIKIDDEYLCFSISGFPDINGKYECFVNNECFSLENPFSPLQNVIEKKNQKYDNFIKHCDECYLLVCKPGVSKGNYCHFTDEILNHKFTSKFKNIFLYDVDKHSAIELKSL